VQVCEEGLLLVLGCTFFVQPAWVRLVELLRKLPSCVDLLLRLAATVCADLLLSAATLATACTWSIM
jgi:hypothetical protein